MTGAGTITSTITHPESSTREKAKGVRKATFLAMSVPGDALAGYGRALGIQRTADALEALAGGLASSPCWPIDARATLLVRSEPRPILAVFGLLLEGEIEELHRQARHLPGACLHLRNFDYPQVAEGCAQLAHLLLDHVGSDLRSARFVAVPKGGLTVLGLVSSALGLEHSQLSPPEDSDPLIVVVDDCSVSGARFAELLQRLPHRRIVFAHLCSHPDLRRAIETAEPRVEACLAVHDLVEQPVAEAADNWRRDWQQKVSWKTYWTGSPQSIGFPWGEPDRCLWNPGTRRIEKAWNLLPPSLCLKNHLMIPVQIQAPTPGPIRAADDVLFSVDGNQAHIANLASGEGLVLNSVATAMWLTLLQEGRLQPSVDSLCREFEVEADTLTADLQQLMEELMARRFLINDETDPLGPETKTQSKTVHEALVD